MTLDQIANGEVIVQSAMQRSKPWSYPHHLEDVLQPAAPNTVVGLLLVEGKDKIGSFGGGAGGILQLPPMLQTG